VFKRGVVAALRAKDRVIDDAVVAARTDEVDALKALAKKAHATTDSIERSSSSGASAVDEKDVAASADTLREELIRIRLELAVRTAAEQVTRSKSRAACALVAEFEAALARASGAALEVTLKNALERHAAAAAVSGLGDDTGYDPNAVSTPPAAALPTASIASTSFSISGDGAAATAAALAAERERVIALSAQLAKAQGDVARARDESAAFRDKAAALRSAANAGAEALRASADASSRLSSALGEKELLDRETSRLSAELAETRAALDAAREMSGMGGIAGEELRRERDTARAEADTARDLLSKMTATAADAEARAAAAEADTKSALAEAERAKAVEASAEARAAASMASGGEAAAAQVAALEQALSDAKAKSKAEKEKLKAAAMRQFDDLKSKALDEINREKVHAAEQIASLEAALSQARAGASGSAARLGLVQASASAVRSTNKALSTVVRNEFMLCSGQIGSMRVDIAKAMKRLSESGAGLMEKYKKECIERRRLFNLVQELRGNVRVYARVRPPVAKELEEENSLAVSFPAEGELTMVNSKKQAKSWEFDQVFQPGTSNEAVFEEVEGLIGSTMDGFNVCIFAYGQTGSGKTFTMEGSESSRGVNYRSLDTLFNIASARKQDGWRYDISVSMLEIYNEDIRDMLAERGADGLPVSQGKLNIRESPTGGVFVPGLNIEPVKSRDEVRVGSNMRKIWTVSFWNE
jgi:hypothetical protein